MNVSHLEDILRQLKSHNNSAKRDIYSIKYSNTVLKIGKDRIAAVFFLNYKIRNIIYNTEDKILVSKVYLEM